MIPSKASPIASVKMNDPATNATPSTIANALSASRTLRATRLRHVILSIPVPPVSAPAAKSALAGRQPARPAGAVRIHPFIGQNALNVPNSKWIRGWAGRRRREFTVVGESAQGVVRRPQETAVLPGLAEPPVLPVLPAGWEVLRGVHWPDPSRPDQAVDAMDHLVVGPGGIFVVVDVDGMEAVILEDRGDPALAFVVGTAVDVCLAAAAEVTEALGGVSGPCDSGRTGAPVFGVVRFMTEEHLALSARGVMVCTTRNVVQVLRSCPPVLDAAHVAQVLAALDARLHPERAERAVAVAHPVTGSPAAAPTEPGDATE